MADDHEDPELDVEVDPTADPEADSEVDPREAARDRRRDRDRSAHARALMRTGLAKGFKQILDAQARRAERVSRNEDWSSEESRPKAKPKDERRRP
jgi:hypothetical protein